MCYLLLSVSRFCVRDPDLAHCVEPYTGFYECQSPDRISRDFLWCVVRIMTNQANGILTVALLNVFDRDVILPVKRE